MIDYEHFAEAFAARTDRWEMLRQFVAEWHRPLTDGDGLPAERIAAAEQRLGLQFPLALREWYALAGARRDVTGRQNHLLNPEDLRLDDGVLVFHVENQGVARWGVRVSDVAGNLPDPPVVVDVSDFDRLRHARYGRWLVDAGSLSEFVFASTVFETVISSRCHAFGFGNRSHVERIGQYYYDMGFTLWHWPQYPTRRFAGDGVLIETWDTEISIAAKHEGRRRSAMERIDPDPGERHGRARGPIWDVVSIDCEVDE